MTLKIYKLILLIVGYKIFEKINEIVDLVVQTKTNRFELS